MQDRSQFPPPQRTGGVPPPLSKYYYGPAVSPDGPPAPSETSWSMDSDHQTPPSLPPRVSHNVSSNHSPQWSPYANSQMQSWHLPGPPPTAPPVHQVAQSTYNPNTYGPMPGARFSPINSTWDQSGQSAVQHGNHMWGANHNENRTTNPNQAMKPPLPPRPLSSQSQGQPQYLNLSQDRASHKPGETPFEYLQPVAYSPAPSPSLSQTLRSKNSPDSGEIDRPNYESLPPPPPLPPPKIPPEDINKTNYIDSSQSQKVQLSGQHWSENYQDTVDGSASNTQLFRPTSAEVFPLSASNETQIESHLDVKHSAPGRQFQHNPEQSNLPSNHTQQNDPGSSIDHSTVHNAEDLASQIDEQPTGNSAAEAHRNDSFYWHSPHSSASIAQEAEQDKDIPGTSTLLDATPEPQAQPFSAPPLNDGTSGHFTDMYQSVLGSNNASALGFGGPSDWEHFGDYEGEEIDDTALYTRHKTSPKVETFDDSAELPAESLHSNPVETEITNAIQAPSLHDSVTPEVKSPPQRNDILTIDKLNGDTNTIIDRVSDAKKGVASPESDLLSARSKTSQDNLLEIQRPESQDTSQNEQAYSSSSSVSRQQDLEDLDTVKRLESSEHPIDSRSEPTEELLSSRSRTHELKQQSSTSQKGDLEAHDNYRIEGKAKTNNSIHSQAPSDDVSKESVQEGSAQAPNNIHDNPASNDRTTNSDDQASMSSNLSVNSKPNSAGDLFAELDPWERASLNRYVAMLHEEAKAHTNEEKFKIFKAFSNRETKLRAVLYEAEEKAESTLPSLTKSRSIQRAETINLRRPSSKALPALPSDAMKGQSDGVSEPEMTRIKSPPTSPSKKPPTEDSTKIPHSHNGKINASVKTLPNIDNGLGGDESNEEYSPGGRPIRPRAQNLKRPESEAGRKDNELVQVDGKPAYKPFRYSQGYVDKDDPPLNRRASYRPFAALKLAPLNPSNQEKSPSTDNEKRDVEPLQKDLAYNERNANLSAVEDPTEHLQEPLNLTQQQSHTKHETGVPLDLRRFETADFDPLVSVLPQSAACPLESVKLRELQGCIDAVPDDFGFIHQCVIAWDAKAKKAREEHEKARQIRQGESEQKIDALFNDDEIGYGDISELESEFKRYEASKKADEDRAEYQTFVSEVFDVVWTRLHFEIDQLSPWYNQYTKIATETLAGKDMFEALDGQFALAPTMSSLLTLHQKLEVRHQKAFEAVLERDRRLKKTEVSPWYALGNVTRVKQLEKQFDDAEKKAIVEYCKQRDGRANHLMDVLDQNTLRGVGANQDYMEAVMKAVRRVASGRAFASAPANEANLGLDEVMKAKSVTSVLATSSEQIVQTFHVADMLLNAADYEVSVAKAKLGHAEPAVFVQLKEEKAKEDQKLMRDLQHRLALIREDSRRTNDEIVKLLCFLGAQNGHAGSLPVSTDLGHEKRLKALEEAKQRNALRESSSGTPP